MWKRLAEKDKRLKKGDDFAGDAWIDSENGILTYVSVGWAPPGAGDKDRPEKQS